MFCQSNLTLQMYKVNASDAYSCLVIQAPVLEPVRVVLSQGAAEVLVHHKAVMLETWNPSMVLLAGCTELDIAVQTEEESDGVLVCPGFANGTG